MIKKIVSLLTLIIGVTIITFVLLSLTEADPAEVYARRIYINPTQEEINSIRLELGYDQPLYQQYFNYLVKLGKGDLGKSLVTNNRVIKDICLTLKETLKLIGCSCVWIITLTIFLACLAVKFRNRFVDHLVRLFVILGISVPSFWLGFIFLYVFAVNLKIFNVMDFGTLKGLILPSLTLAIPTTATLVRLLRSNMLSEINKDYFIFARASGKSESKIIFSSVLKNSLPPVITLFFQNIGLMIGGSAIVESVFSWPGLGMYLLNAIMQLDLPAISGCVLIISLIFIACNSLASIINKLLMPKLSMQGVK
ncbi:ABC transporter permease [Clostridium sp. 'deep sea']|uniref:ABC transporter permease n=1 Tax=Clostridium sp. 'deep sea' TaxID=2779445 RepID=UPI001896601D|nr:ABC transporter permease [Clostridium sp. 'deep sea']QOR36302.1 ABC transporter permease [Clostridium sp. 'deep sea']